MAEQMDPLTGKPRRKRKGDRKPQDPMYPMFPDVPAEQQPPAGVNQMFNPTPQNPATRFEGSRYKMPLGQQLVSAFTGGTLGAAASMQPRYNLPPTMGMADPERRQALAPPQISSPTPQEQEAMRQGIRDRRDASVREFDQQRLNRNPSLTPPDMDMPPAPPQLPMSPSAGVPQATAPQQGMPSAAPEPQAPAPMEANPFINTMADRTVMVGQTSPQPPSIMPQEQQMMDMPPAPQDQRLPMSPSAGIQPDMDMPPAPQTRQQPTNQFGQPIRGVLPPERVPEDPNRVMEEFGRGSPEHIAALQDQMRTQQVARSRPEDMNDPRLAGLPTEEEYEMNLTRRRYGEEAINERAAELMEDAPLGRTEADAVRMAGREALNQRRRDRGMLDLDQMQERRDTIRQRGQEMFEQRRARERGERQARRERLQLEREARAEGMSPEQLLRARAERDAIGAEERMAQENLALQREALAQQGQEAQRSYKAQIRDLEERGRQFDATNLRMIQEFARTSGLRKQELDNAATALTNDSEHRKIMAKIAQGELDLKEAVQEFAETQFAKRGEMTKAELLTLVAQSVSASQGTFTVPEFVQGLAVAFPMINEMVDPTVIESVENMVGQRRTTTGARSAESVVPLDTPLDWIDNFGNFESDWWLIPRWGENTDRLYRGYLGSMDKTLHELATMEDREAAQAVAADLSQRMSEAGYGDAFDPVGIGLTFGVSLADQMDDARTAAYTLFQTMAVDGTVDPGKLAAYQREFKKVSGMGRSKFASATPSRRD